MRAKSNLFVNVVAMLASGLAIGWLMGMSVSPAVQTVLGSVLTLLLSILGLLAGVNAPPAGKSPVTGYLHDINLLPVGVFLLFLAIGSGTGVYVRANNLLGRSPRQLVADYDLDGTRQKQALQLVFARDMQDSSQLRPGKSVLYAGSSSLCSAIGTELRMSLKNLDNNAIYQLLIDDASDSTLIKIRDEYCHQK